MSRIATQADRRARVHDGVLVLGVIAVDQAVKLLVASRFLIGERHVIVPGWLEVTYLLNTGGVWGLGRAFAGTTRTALFIALPVVITLFAALYAWSLAASDRLRHVAISLVVGGALGNLVDRLRLRPPAVVDYILAHARERYYWPAFNVADSCICIGIAVLLVSSFFADADADAEVPASSSGAGSEAAPARADSA